MKVCSQCEETKDFDQFHKRSRLKDGYASYCKECSRKYYKSWQDQGEGRNIRRADWKKVRVRDSRIKLLEYLSDKGCADCGTTDVRVLEFDHVAGEKVGGVAKLVGQGSSWEKVLEEINKCEIRCCNHHRIKSAERGRWWLHQSSPLD